MKYDKVGSKFGEMSIIRVLDLLCMEFEYSERSKPILEQGIIIEAHIMLPEDLYEEWSKSCKRLKIDKKVYKSTPGRNFTVRRIITK